MKRFAWVCALIALALAFAVAALTGAQDLQQKVAAVKQVAAANQKALRSYTWLEKTELSLKGEVKATKVDSCRYGPDGKVQKTPVVTPPPQEKKGGLKGRMIAKKTEEMKDELEAAASLIHQYVPPDPGMMQIVVNAGALSISPGPALAKFTFAGYAKQGDALTLTFDSALKSIGAIDVATWLEAPDKPVTFRVTMQSLPDGTSHPADIVLSIPASKIEVRIAKTNYQKLAQ